MAHRRRSWTDEYSVADTDFALGAAIVAAVFLAMTALLNIPLDALVDDLWYLVAGIFLP